LEAVNFVKSHQAASISEGVRRIKLRPCSDTLNTHKILAMMLVNRITSKYVAYSRIKKTNPLNQMKMITSNKKHPINREEKRFKHNKIGSRDIRRNWKYK